MFTISRLLGIFRFVCRDLIRSKQYVLQTLDLLSRAGLTVSLELRLLSFDFFLARLVSLVRFLSKLAVENSKTKLKQIIDLATKNTLTLSGKIVIAEHGTYELILVSGLTLEVELNLADLVRKFHYLPRAVLESLD